MQSKAFLQVPGPRPRRPPGQGVSPSHLGGPGPAEVRDTKTWLPPHRKEIWECAQDPAWPRGSPPARETPDPHSLRELGAWDLAKQGHRSSAPFPGLGAEENGEAGEPEALEPFGRKA